MDIDEKSFSDTDLDDDDDDETGTVKSRKDSINKNLLSNS